MQNDHIKTLSPLSLSVCLCPRSVLQNRLRAPQDRHLSPQRWRGRGIRWIGGSLYRVSANKLSRAAASSLPINRTGALTGD